MIVVPIEDVNRNFSSSEKMVENDGGEVDITFLPLVEFVSFGGDKVSTAWAGSRVLS